MKFISTIIFLFFFVSGNCQFNSNTTLSKKALDSIVSANNYLIGRNKLLNYKIRLVDENVQTDSIRFGNDSTHIRFNAKDGCLIKRIRIRIINGCVRFSIEEYFNEKGLLEYSETTRHSCEIVINTDPEIFNFDSMLEQLERFEYDKEGRITLRVWWYYSIGARKYSYSYNPTKKVTVTKVWQNEFWQN